VTTTERVRALGAKLRTDNVSLIAAGVSFFAALAVIPATVIAVSAYGIFTNPRQAEMHVESLLEVLPETTARTLEAQINPIADFSHLHLSLGLIVSVIALLWTVSNAARAIVRAVVIAAGQGTSRSPLETRLASLGLAVSMITVATAAVAVIAAVPAWLAALDPGHVILTFSNMRWALIGLLFVGGVTVLYRVAPPTRPKTWRAILPGAVLATGLWILLSIGFSVYVSHFGRYNETYGTLGAGAVLLLWFWLSSIVIIIGAQINAVWGIEPAPAPARGAATAMGEAERQQSGGAGTGTV
jgi:membrane protein